MDPKIEEIRNCYPRIRENRIPQESIETETKPTIKKQKLDHEVETPSTSPTIDFLPNEVLVEIFKYLDLKDLLNIQRVSSRWCHIAKSGVLWKCLKLSGISPSFFIKFLASLPTCVSFLKLECHSEPLPASLPEVMAKIHKQCPFLRTFILENIHLVKNFHNVQSYQTRTSKLLNARLLEEAKYMLRDETLMQFIESDLWKSDLEHLDAASSELKVLSLRRVLFSQIDLYHISNSIFPNIAVLDLSHSGPLSLPRYTDDIFSTLDGIEELYLTGWRIKDSNLLTFLKCAKKLRVLDVEFSDVGKNTITALKANCQKLEKLYLSHTAVREICTFQEEGEFFPHLEFLCLKYTAVTRRSIERLLTVCPSLKLVDVQSCENITFSWYESLPKCFREIVNFDSDFRVIQSSCEHFLNTEHYNF